MCISRASTQTVFATLFLGFGVGPISMGVTVVSVGVAQGAGHAAEVLWARLRGVALPPETRGSPPGEGWRRFRVLETTVADDPTSSSAVVADVPANLVATVSIGHFLDRSQVHRIERMRVVLDVDHRCVTLDSSGVRGGRPASTNDRAHEDLSRDAVGDPPLAFEVSRRFIRKFGGPANNIGAGDGIAVIPNVHPPGLALRHVVTGGFYDLLGLRDGDIVRRVNGYETTSVTEALDAYDQLSDASQIEVEIERDGRQIKRSYVIE